MRFMKTQRITIEVSEDQKRNIKILATLSNLNIKEFILDRTIGLEPNEETLKSFQDYENKVALKKNDNFDDFWNEIIK